MAVYAGSARDPLGTGRMTDISMGGAALACFVDLHRGSTYDFEIGDPDARRRDRLRLSGVVVWQSGPPTRSPKPERSYGVTFVLSGRQEGLLKRFIDMVRMEQSPKDEDPPRDYWSV
ncbi:MAG: PilZ domain-containing protein [Elusimicrobia bacterium]|nr:PilZ domain-containing protein [Elusimicrobiota bacterium]MDE2313890.1 PilZ domain-containing protein [Elusimicrobiota bacterium]